MAVEVDRRRFVFLPEHEYDPLTISPAPALPPPPPPWFHNPIHDLESTWWVALWTLYHLRNLMDGASLFTEQQQRGDIWIVSRSYLDLCAVLPKEILGLLEGWRLFMRQQYQELEKQVVNNSHFSFDYDPVFEGALKCIKAIINALSVPQDPSPGLERSPNTSDTPPRKRQRVKHNQDST